jgi:hypothetical protein
MLISCDKLKCFTNPRLITCASQAQESDKLQKKFTTDQPSHLVLTYTRDPGNSGYGSA